MNLDMYIQSIDVSIECSKFRGQGTSLGIVDVFFVLASYIIRVLYNL